MPLNIIQIHLIGTKLAVNLNATSRTNTRHFYTTMNCDVQLCEQTEKQAALLREITKMSEKDLKDLNSHTPWQTFMLPACKIKIMGRE